MACGKGKKKKDPIACAVGILAALGFMLCITGCGHNVVTYSDGIGIETQINPETYTFGLNFRYGKIFTATVRENSEIEMQGKGEASGDVGESAKGSTGGTVDGAVKIKIGKQISGYYVEAIKAGATPESINAYLDGETSEAK